MPRRSWGRVSCYAKSSASHRRPSARPDLAATRRSPAIARAAARWRVDKRPCVCRQPDMRLHCLPCARTPLVCTACPRARVREHGLSVWAAPTDDGPLDT
eukprot:5227174-Prymnesium_polylepis.1